MTEAFEQLLHRLQLHWTEQGLRPSAPASETEVRTFEARHRVVLESELRVYFGTLNGVMGGRRGRWDEEHISFWNLSEVEELRESPHPERGQDLFVFADWSLWAHAYAFRPGASGQRSEVFLVGGEVPKRVAVSFGDFLRGYLAGDQRVLFGAGNGPEPVHVRPAG